MNPRLACASLLLVAGLLVAPSAAAEPVWHRLELEDCTVLGDVPIAELESVARAIELHRHALRRLLPSLPKTSAVRPRVFVLKAASFRRFSVMSSTAVAFVTDGEFSADVALSGSEWMSSQLLVQNMLTRRYMRSALKSIVPAWYQVGVAELLATTREYEGKLAIGLPNAARLLSANTLPWLPLRDVLDDDPDSDGARRSELAKEAFQAQSWLLMHYTLVQRTGFAPKINELAADADAGLAARAAIDKALPAAEFARFERELKAYAAQRSLPFVTLPLPDQPAHENPRPVPDVEALAAVGRMMLQTPAIKDRRLVRSVVAEGIAAEHPLALAVRANLEVHHRNVGEARSYAERCDRTDSDSTALTLCGDAWLQLHDLKARSVSPELLRARGLYERAEAMNPDNVEAVYSRTLTYLTTDQPPAQLLTALNRALERQPGSMQLRLAVARMLRQSGDLAAARGHLERALAYSRHLDTRKLILAQLREVETQLAEAERRGQ